jgi:hypothetical protein
MNNQRRDTMKLFTARAIAAAVVALTLSAAPALAGWGPATPDFNLEAQLRPVAGASGFGLVKFRQPKDADKIAYLDAWVRDLTPNQNYSLQRATDTNVDDSCTGTNWLTLGRGPAPQSITTDDNGTGRAELFRDLAAIALGTEFDIKFRVVDAATSAIVLETACYQYRVSR